MHHVEYEIYYRMTPQSPDALFASFDDPELAEKRRAQLAENPAYQNLRVVKVLRVELPITMEGYLHAISAITIEKEKQK